MNVTPRLFRLVLAWILLSLFDSFSCVAGYTLPQLHKLRMKRDITVTGSVNPPGMSQHAAKILATALIVVAVVFGVVYYFNHLRSWYLRLTAPPAPAAARNDALPGFLRNRPAAGAIPVVISPRTTAIVAANRSLYSMPPAVHAVPHYTANVHHGVAFPIYPPPPVYHPSSGAQRA